MLNKYARGSGIRVYQNYINGQWISSSSNEFYQIKNPALNEVIAQVPLSNSRDIRLATENLSETFKIWKKTSVSSRTRYMLKFKDLIRKHIPELSLIISEEQGKTLLDAEGDVYRGAESVDFSLSASFLLSGNFVSNVSKNMDCYSFRAPLGVCAGITPFNFPAFIPLIIFPLAIVTGNTFLLKPSKSVPGTTLALIDLLEQTGLPEGVINIVNGGKEVVNGIIEDDNIKAISFVGSSEVGEYIYREGSKRGKRIQMNGAAKNHAVIMPDADPESVINSLVGGCFGATGQRCMALGVAIFVGESEKLIPEIVKRVKSLKIGIANDNPDLGPVISKESQNRICKIIKNSKNEGAELLLDGSDFIHPIYKKGFFVGPTIITNVNTQMECYKKEIFGPVMVILKCENYQQALDIVNKNKYGNGACIYTKSGSVSRKFQNEVECGLIGINVPIPIPLPFLSFTGNKESFKGDLNFFGKTGFDFFTQIKTVTSQWSDDKLDLSMEMPLLK